jgi:hypothetical protein
MAMRQMSPNIKTASDHPSPTKIDEELAGRVGVDAEPVVGS